MFTKTKVVFLLFSALMAGSILFAGCAVAPQQTTTSAPVATEAPTPESTSPISIDLGDLAIGFQLKIVPAVPAGSDLPYWEMMPEHRVVTLDGYPISDHLMQPQIFIYPLDQLGEYNEGAGQIAATLQTLLQSPQEIKNMPFLPLFNAGQVLHTHVQYLESQNATGVRYLTMFSQGIVPVNNYELFYTYQGVTRDGKYYIAAVLPVNHPSLPGNGTVTGNEPPEFTSDFLAYLDQVVKDLNPQAASSFTPDLTQLDALINSLEVR